MCRSAMCARLHKHSNDCCSMSRHVSGFCKRRRPNSTVTILDGPQPRHWRYSKGRPIPRRGPSSPMSASSSSTICPKCSRQVPTSVSTCRCGQAIEHPRPQSTVETTDAQPTRANSSTSMAMLAVVLTVGILIVGWLGIRRDPPPLPRQNAAAAAPAPTVVVEPTVAAPEPPPHNPFEDLLPPSKDKPADTPTPALPTLSLEELITKTMPAVVRIESSAGTGSGFFVRPDTILTNVHVVTTNSAVTVRRPDGTTVRGRVERT